MRLAALWIVMMTTAAATPAEDAKPLQVGVYSRALGGKAVARALAKEKGLKVVPVAKIDPESLLACDVLVVGACSLDQPAQVKAVRVFLACGGGMVLNHQSCGRNRPETLFPAIVKRVVDRREDTVLAVRDAAHPLTAGLPAQFAHAYHDHLFLEPGPEGKVLVADREGAAVVVAGEIGAGRIVMNGSLPGYRYDPVSFTQGEAEPAGDELRLLANAVAWAGTGRLTSVPADELAKRRAAAERDLKLEDLSKLLPTADWFAPEMLRGSYAPPQPVGELGGRFFITYDAQCWRGYKLKKIENEQQLEFFRSRLRLDVCQLKWLGVTDIIYWTDVSGERVFHPTEVPDSDVQVRGVDPLAELIRLATPEGMNVWASWHSCFRSEKYAQKYCAKDAQGKFYKYGGSDYCEDLLSPAYRQRCRQFLDEYAAKYKPLGNFLGLAAYDELWFTGYDMHGDDLAAIERFCVERFGEKPPADMADRLAAGRKWLDADDVWRRRYILFRQHVVTDFWRDLVEHAHRKGLQIGVELLATAYYPTGWTWGMDSVALSRLGADFYATGGGGSPANSYPNTVRWSHVHDSWGLYNTHCLRGGPGGIFFTFNQLWRLVMYANNPALPRELGRHIPNPRQWSGAAPLPRVALLQNQEALQMLVADTRPYVNRAAALCKALQRSQDVEWIFTRAPARFPAVRLLVAMPYSVRGLSQEVYDRLRRFVAEGGAVVSVDADWTVAREDLTQEQNRTAEMLGVRYGSEASSEAFFEAEGQQVKLLAEPRRRAATLLEGTDLLARFADGSPAVTVRKLGKGRVIGLHFAADAELEKNDNRALAAFLAALSARESRPEIVAEGAGFRVISTLRKGNWVAVALYPDVVPCQGRLRVDLAALGIPKTGFRMLMLGKQMEIGRPGDLWGETGFWTADELKRGFPVTIPASDDRKMPLPEELDTSEFRGRKGADHAAYVQGVTRDWWDSQTRGQRKRNYAHEIVVLAPGDEPGMPK